MAAGFKGRRPELIYLAQETFMKFAKKVDKQFDAAIAYLRGSSDKIEKLVALRQKIEPNYVPSSNVIDATVGEIKSDTSYLDRIEFYKNCRKHGKPISSHQYSLIFEALQAENQTDKILSIFDECIDQGKANVDLFNQAIQIFAKTKQAENALKLYHVMQSESIPPNAGTFSLLIYIYSNLKHQMDKAEEILGKMEQYGIKPQIAHFETLLSGYARENNLDKIIELLERSHHEKLQSEQQFKTAITTFSKNKKFDQSL